MQVIRNNPQFYYAVRDYVVRRQVNGNHAMFKIRLGFEKVQACYLNTSIFDFPKADSVPFVRVYKIKNMAGRDFDIGNPYNVAVIMNYLNNTSNDKLEWFVADHQTQHIVVSSYDVHTIEVREHIDGFICTLNGNCDPNAVAFASPQLAVQHVLEIAGYDYYFLAWKVK